MFREWNGNFVALILAVLILSPSFAAEFAESRGDSSDSMKSKTAGATGDTNSKPPGIEDSLKVISANLKKWQADLAEPPWHDSTPNDIMRLDTFRVWLDKIYKYFPSPEGWPIPGKKLDFTQAYQIRDLANAAMFKYVHARAQLASKSEAVRQKMLEDKLANIQSNLPKVDTITSNLRGWHIGIAGILFLLLGGLGLWGYVSLRKKIAAYGLDQPGRINQHSQLKNDLNLSLEEQADKIISSIKPLSGETPPEGKKADSDSKPKPPPPKTKSPIETLVELYNTSVRDNQKISEFRQRYPITTIGIKNAEERAGNPKIDPIFWAADNGDFYAIDIEQNGRRTYVVVPSFGFIFSEKKYNNAGLSHVFKCRPEALKSQGNLMIVKKTAHFKPDSQGTIWELEEQGEIDLEQG